MFRTIKIIRDIEGYSTISLVTTNPCAKEGRDFKEVIKEITHLC